MIAALLSAALVLIFLAIFWRRVQGVRDREWEREWRELPWRERLRIGRTVSRGEAVTDRRRMGLAADAARSQRRVLEALPDPWVAHVAVSAILAAVALVSGELLALPLAAAWLAAGLALRAWGRRRIRRLERAERRNRASP